MSLFPAGAARFRPTPALLLGAVLSLIFVAPAAAQGWIGLANSNYGGTNNLYINPSSVADSRHKAYLNVLGVDVNFYNTYLQLDLPVSPLSDAFKNYKITEKNLTEQLSGGTKFASISGELRLPSLMLSLGNSQGLAFTNRVRSFMQVSSVSENLARLSRYGLAEADRLGLGQRLLEDNSFNINTNTYHEFALTYGRTFTANTTHFFKGGLTLKYLVGLGGGYVLNEGTKYVVYGRDSIQVRTPNLGYGFTDYQIYQQNGFKVGSLYGANRLGQGFGADLGATYEWRPKADKYEYHMDNKDWTNNAENKYKLRLGLAFTDIGGISYKDPRYVRRAELQDTRTVNLGQLDTIHFRTLQSINPTVSKLVGLKGEGTQFFSYLPTTLRLTADYRLVNHIYTGLLWTQNLLLANTIGSRSISSLALTPRVEFSRLELAVPLILANNYQKFQIGAMLRLGPLFVGSDNLGGLFALTSTTGADFYFGLGLGLHKHRHHDRDGDQVSNKLDKCPKVKGTWEFNGCPDTDGDHVADALDDCPTVAGLPQFRGCPDTDGDGLPDKTDACPTLAGPAALHGCPDQDGDGVADADDHCPRTPGLPERAGCPDTDSDGLYDDTDQCPTAAGPAENHGCPYADQDHDTVPDKDDACPTEPGPAANKGCPVAEVAPVAPLPVAPLPVAAGDLDTDGDTVPDAADACPLTPGPATNKGCPELKAAEAKVLKTAFANLEFETNKDVIRAKSLPSLKALAGLLKEKPEFRLRLNGYTDNVGKPALNLLLSKKRAQAVQRYLVKQGVPATSIRAEWFGRAKPVAPNTTAAGRARNRRVEMTVLFD